MLRNFRDSWLINQTDGKSIVKEYYEIAPKIVAKINQFENSSEIYRRILKSYIAPCLKLIESGKFTDCKNKYVEMVQNLRTELQISWSCEYFGFNNAVRITFLRLSFYGGE